MHIYIYRCAYLCLYFEDWCLYEYIFLNHLFSYVLREGLSSPKHWVYHYGHIDWEEKPWYLFWLLGSPGIRDKCCFTCLFIWAEDLNSALVLSTTETSLQIQMDNFKVNRFKMYRAFILSYSFHATTHTHTCKALVPFAMQLPPCHTQTLFM